MSRDPFDIAPRAARNTLGGWIVLLIGSLFAVTAAIVLWNAGQRLDEAHKQANESAVGLSTLRAKGTGGQHTGTAASAVALERGKENLELARMLRFSWSSLFDALESAGSAVEGRVTIASIAPVNARADIVQVDLSALAVSTPAMLEYVRTLERRPGVLEVRLTMQQPATHGTAQVVSFQLALMWDAREPLSAVPGAK